MIGANNAKILEVSLDNEVEDLLRSAYPELRRIARRLMARERQGHTLQPTELLNEALGRLIRREIDTADARRYIAAAIREMQTILIDWGRKRKTREAGMSTPAEPGSEPATATNLEEMLHLQLCLEKLGEVDPRARQVVELRYFAGLTVEEVAEYLNIAARTVNADWEFARCWMARHWADQ